MNDDSTTDSYEDTCSSWYDSNPGDCGDYDDEDFTASKQCCACGGGTGEQADGVGKCRYNEAVDSDQCPPEEELEVMANCKEVACGELCEGDGECDTTDIDNCGGYDVYRKFCTSPTAAPTKKVDQPTARPTYKPTFARCEGVASTSSATVINVFESSESQISAERIKVDRSDGNDGEAQALLKFDLSEYDGCGDITKAMLRLHTLGKSKDTIEAYRCLCLICGPRGGDDEASEHEQGSHALKLITKRTYVLAGPLSLSRKNPFCCTGRPVYATRDVI